MNNAKIGTAVLGAYLLGRKKKAKMALGLGMAMAGARVRPGQLGRALADSPFVGELGEQVRTELLSAGRTAAGSLLTAKADRLADTLHERTAGLREKAPGDGGEPADDASGGADERDGADTARDEHRDEHRDEKDRDEKDRGGGRDENEDEDRQENRGEDRGGSPRRNREQEARAGSPRRRTGGSAPGRERSGTARPRRAAAEASATRRPDDG
ncbi:ABC transporter substrate-binding protein [Streptomyces pactum]|uniref:ABC transporter substrate-binding protein n=1 Tax=Streptomyces pactum TaxID=68249 RepID=A0ABS0NSU7_9ACTN|nr:ABC transporter substrate-binding protein [Streptomyces pactum]MBH5338132.1 ABC transporter substrate-binding protein [Streptomyces pactum]